jgi:hypothetical protein
MKKHENQAAETAGRPKASHNFSHVLLYHLVVPGCWLMNMSIYICMCIYIYNIYILCIYMDSM